MSTVGAALHILLPMLTICCCVTKTDYDNNYINQGTVGGMACRCSTARWGQQSNQVVNECFSRGLRWLLLCVAVSLFSLRALCSPLLQLDIAILLLDAV